MQERTRNFATIVYPESSPDDWITRLDEQHIPAFISPLHNRDVDKEGKIKKEHHHVLLMFEGLKTKHQAEEVFDLIGGVGTEIVKSIRSYSRYLCHLDNKDKITYATDEVIALGGADYNEIISLAADKYTLLGEIFEFIEGNDIYSYSDILYFAKYNRKDWFKVLCDNAYLMNQFLYSKRFSDIELMDFLKKKGNKINE